MIDNFKSKKLISFLSEFGIESAVSIEVAGEGRIATNYIIYTSNDERYILRIYDLKQGVDLGYGKDQIEFEAKVLQYVDLHSSIQTPQLLSPKNGNGQQLLIRGTDMVMLYRMLEGKSLDQTELTTQTAYQSGECLRTLINTFLSFKDTSNAPEGGISYIADITEKLKLRNQGIFQNPKLFEMYRYITQFPKKSDLENSPQGIVHGDFFFENTLWAPDKTIVGVIDFGDSFYGSVLHDIAIGAMEFSIQKDEHIDFKMLDAFLSGFTTWFEETTTDVEIFRATLLANCVRYMTHLMSLGLDNGNPHYDLLAVENNPYISRFHYFSNPKSLLKTV